METAPRIKTYYACPCGWKREYTDTEEWKRRHIRHPLWGYVTQIAAVHLDTQQHNCLEHIAAVKRSPRARDEVIYDYEAAQARKELEQARESVGGTRA